MARKRYGWAALALVAAAAFVGWIAWTALDEGGSAGPETGVTVDDLVDDPDRYVGRTVTVSGEVSAVLDEDAVFIGGETLGGDGGFPGGRSVLVVSRDLPPLAGGDGRVVEVTGEVRVLDADALEREFRIEDELLDDEFETPAVVAERVSVSGG